jgi:hypothetical protein
VFVLLLSLYLSSPFLMGTHNSKHKKRSDHAKKEKSAHKKDKVKGGVVNAIIVPSIPTVTTASITTFSVSDGSNINSEQSDPDVVNGNTCADVQKAGVDSGDNVVLSLKEATVLSVEANIEGVDIHVDEADVHLNGADQDEVQNVHVCMLCDIVQAEKFYSLEVCGHGFCIPCIFAYSEEQLKGLPEDCCEILCPLEKCGCAISVADLKKALATFGSADKNGGAPDKVEPYDHNGGEPSGNASEGASSSANAGASSSKSNVVLPIQLTRSLETFLAKNSNYVHCPNPKCKVCILFITSKLMSLTLCPVCV